MPVEELPDPFASGEALESGSVRHPATVPPEEQEPPSEGAEEWLHYDPNWRQFLGCVLAYILERHALALPPLLNAEIEIPVSEESLENHYPF